MTTEQWIFVIGFVLLLPLAALAGLILGQSEDDVTQDKHSGG